MLQDVARFESPLLMLCLYQLQKKRYRWPSVRAHGCKPIRGSVTGIERIGVTLTQAVVIFTEAVVTNAQVLVTSRHRLVTSTDAVVTYTEAVVINGDAVVTDGNALLTNGSVLLK